MAGQLLLATLLIACSSHLISASGSLIRKNYGLNGANLKFALYNLPPRDIVTMKPDGNYSLSGSNSFLYPWIAEKLNFTISWVIINSSIIAEKGSSFGIAMELLANKEVDALTVGVYPTPERKKKIDFGYIAIAESYFMLVPRPGEEPRLFAFIRPFTPTVWLLILVATLMMIGAMSFFMKINYANFIPRNQQPFTLSGVFTTNALYVINILTNQGREDRGTHLRSSFRILVGAWLLAAMVLVNSYSSTVIAYLMAPKLKPSINALQDLAVDQDIDIIVWEETIIGQIILGAQSGIFKTIGDKVRKKPDQLLNDIDKITARLIDNERKSKLFAFPYTQSVVQFIIGNQFKKERNCRYQLSRPLPIFGMWLVALQKDSKYRQMINDASMELWETGLPPFWTKSFLPSAPKCFAKTKPETSRRVPIRLQDLTGPFFVLGIGLSLAIFVFLVEIIFSFWQKKISNEKNIRNDATLNAENISNEPIIEHVSVL